MSSDSNVIISPEPLKPRVENLKTLPGVSLAGALRCAIAQNKLDYVDLPRVEIRVNGEVQPKTPEALDRCLLEGDLVLIEVKAHGDNPLRTAFQIFIQVGAAIVGVMFGPWAAAAVQLGGALLTSVLFPPNKPEQLADANDSGALRDQSNNIRRRYPMPLVLGKQRVGFDVAAMGYTENFGNESWINVIFGVHYGPCQVEDIKIGETLLADYPATDYQIEYFLTPGSRNSNLYKRSKFQENMNNELDLHGVYEVATLQEGADQAEIDITLPNGLHFTNDKGKKSNEEVAGHIQYAEVGTENWVNAGLPPAYNKNGVLMPAGSFYINARTQDAIRRTYTFSLPDQTKHYKVRVKAYDYDNRFDDTSVWETYWTAMRSVFFKKPIIDETLACVVLRVKSSGDLNGTLPVVSGLVTPIVPIYEDGNWNTTAPSSNMAACLRWALTGPAASTPLTEDEINESCATAYELIESNDWHAAVYVTDEISQEDLMKVCGSAGRFSTYWSGEDLCFVTDWEKPIPRQIFSAKNVSNYKFRREFQDEIHAVFVEFRNVDEGSGADEVWVYADGYNQENATKFETIRLPYLCTLERAYKEGRVYLAKRELKTETHEWTCAWDGVTATYGDRVKVGHHAALYGKAAGRVVNRWFNPDKTQVLGIRVDFYAEMEAGIEYSVDVRRTNQAILGIPVTNIPGSSKTIMFEDPILVDDAPLKDDLVVFGETNLVTEDVEIDSFDYQDGVNVRIIASPYIAELVEAAETGPIPPIVTGLTQKLPAPVPRILSTRGLVDGVEVLFDVIEDQNRPIKGFVAQWRYSTGTWNTLPVLGASARSFKTPPIQAAAYDLDDTDLLSSKILVDVQIITLLRRGDFSLPAVVEEIEVVKEVLAPTNFDAISVVRVSSTGSSYPVIAVIADPITAGDIQYLDVEFARVDEDLDEQFFDSAGQPLPASNPVGDFRNVVPGESYVVRGRFKTQDNWVSQWVYVNDGEPLVISGGSNVSDDIVNIGGRPVGDLISDFDHNADQILSEAVGRLEGSISERERRQIAARDAQTRLETLAEINPIDGTAVMRGDNVQANPDGLFLDDMSNRTDAVITPDGDIQPTVPTRISTINRLMDDLLAAVNRDLDEEQRRQSNASGLHDIISIIARVNPVTRRAQMDPDRVTVSGVTVGEVTQRVTSGLDAEGSIIRPFSKSVAEGSDIIHSDHLSLSDDGFLVAAATPYRPALALGQTSMSGLGVNLYVTQERAEIENELLAGALVPAVATEAQAITALLDTDETLAANSDLKVPSQKAVKAYADALIAANDAMVFKGDIDCSSSPNYPAADRGWTYRVSAAGKIGGVSGVNVEVGDFMTCRTDATASGNHATVGANWSVIQANLDGAVIGPTSAVSGRIATFSGTSGKLIADSGKGLPVGDLVGTSDVQTLTNKTLTSPVINSPTGITKTNVGLSNVDNTSDPAKPVSTAQQAALDLKANAANAAFTGTTPTVNGVTMVTRTAAETLTNKTLEVVYATLLTYADNAAAVAGGLAVGRLYKTSSGEIRIVV